jgi:hypothetical protein
MLIDGGPEGTIITSLTACEYFNYGCSCGKCIAKKGKMDKQITADWARQQATAILGERVSKEIETCEQAIKQAVTKNEMSCYVSIYAHQNTIKELTSRGFEVKQHSDQREGNSLHIKW